MRGARWSRETVVLAPSLLALIDDGSGIQRHVPADDARAACSDVAIGRRARGVLRAAAGSHQHDVLARERAAVAGDRTRLRIGTTAAAAHAHGDLRQRRRLAACGGLLRAIRGESRLRDIERRKTRIDFAYVQVRHCRAMHPVL